MLEKLFELLLSAKSGAIAAVFVIGTTGALVTATVQNGVTTITITEASASPSASASPTASPSASPSTTVVNPTASPSASPSSNSSTTSANACSDQAHAAADAVKTVNTAFNGFHTDLEHMRKDVKTDATRKTLETADRQLQSVRDGAVKAIHALNTCAKNDDEDANEDQDKDQNKDDENKDEDSGTHSQTNFVLAFFQKFLGKDAKVTIVTASPTASPVPTVSPSPTATASTSTVAFTGTDPKAIADQAVAAMKLIFDNAKTQLPTSTATTRPAPTHRPEGTKRPEPSHGTERD